MSSYNDDDLKSKSGLVIAFDFGTTFTGVAFYHSGGAIGEVNEHDVYAIAQKVDVIDTWPLNPSLQYTEKTPTILAYHTDPPIWGGSVRPSHTLQVARFKLGLEPSVTLHYGYPNSNCFGRHPNLPDKEPVDFTTEYLTCVQNYLQNVCLPRQFGDDFLQNQRMTYIVTVPAIWTDKAKDLTRRAASQAVGVPFTDNSLILISEPEAAALYCSSMCQKVDLKAGDRFLVCDAGGGTVVNPRQSQQ